MILPNSDDTIVAISTPPGYGGIGVIRLSGKRAFPIVSSLIDESIDLEKIETHTLHYCHIVGCARTLIDEVIVAIFKAPKSYTGEDVVEISAHGNPHLLQQIVKLAIAAGARQAAPGEFTLRAFQSGRIDLVQAEAVADLIGAAGEAAEKSALYQLSGGLSDYLDSLREELVEIAALFEAYTDFPDEEIHPLQKEELAAKLNSVSTKLSRLAQSYGHGKIIKTGVQIPIIGPPNAGKSSLFNAILAEERAIVTEIAGTTRDTIGESIELAGLPVRFIDTAGLGEPANLIEAKGIDRSQREIAGATLVIAVFDITQLCDLNQSEAEDRVKDFVNRYGCEQPILVLNKIDLVTAEKVERSAARFAVYRGIFTSATELAGIDQLLEEITGRIESNLPVGGDQNMLTSERHYQAAVSASQIVADVESKLADNLSFEFLAFDLKEAIGYLEEILGRISSEELLNEIFSRFCIGK
ncbi:MAG: tRNA uridine-5-carboxymethylaminomethyl(34) synthesis GTPase MnmE [candidate division Zixibacteria bacterium]|nr:tRNA uridine-5-carboxymethylaminomethyl(34) synthesis GTPase MnmE [candidate division Zixibacteria bacterium]